MSATQTPGILELSTARVDLNNGQDDSSKAQAKRRAADECASKPSLPINHISWESLQCLEVIGKGGTGKVLKVKSKADDALYAMKSIRRTASAACGQELRILQYLSDVPGVTKVHGVYQSRRHFYLLMDLCHCSLFQALLELGRIPENMCRNIILKVTSALAQIHQKDILHGDIKPENILVVSSWEHLTDEKIETLNPDVKICDFGLSQVVRDGKLVRTSAGTAAYSSAEKLRGEGTGKPLDLWALGVVTFVLLGGYHPFDEYSVGSDTRIQERIKANDWTFDNTGGEWSGVSSEARNFISALLRHDPAHRLTAAECLQHSWLRKANNETVRRHSYRAADRPKTALPRVSGRMWYSSGHGRN